MKSTHSVEETAELKALFDALQADDFDRREHALTKLTALGPSLLPRIDVYLKQDNPQQATLAGQLRLRILVEYDGYVPTPASVRQTMKTKLNTRALRTPVAILQAAAKTLGTTLVIDPAVRLPESFDEFERMRMQLDSLPIENAIGFVESFSHVRVVPRGTYLLVTTHDTGAKVLQQRHIFDWSELRLGRDEAQRVGDALKVFFPADCEIHAASETFTVRGSEDSIARAARLLEALKPSDNGLLWPPVKADMTAVMQKLQSPVDLTLNAEDPIHVIDILRASGHVIGAVGFSGEVAEEGKLPAELRGAAPARLRLAQVPLAYALHWVQRRTRFTTTDLDGCILAYELNPEGRIVLRVKKKLESPLDNAMLGVDAGFLYPKNAKPSEAIDAEVKQKALAALAPHLSLLPVLDADRAFFALRGRLFIQGSAPALLFIAQHMQTWKETGQAPAPTPFHAAMQEKLDAPQDWDGRGLTGGRLLSKLRAMGKLNLLLEDGPDGTAPSFELSPQDAQLLPPGKHSLRQLLDVLAAKARATWSVEYGAVVLRPKAAAKP